MSKEQFAAVLVSLLEVHTAPIKIVEIIVSRDPACRMPVKDQDGALHEVAIRGGADR